MTRQYALTHSTHTQTYTLRSDTLYQTNYALITHTTLDPSMSVATAVSRSVPLGYRWLPSTSTGTGLKTSPVLGALPPRLQSMLDDIVATLHAADASADNGADRASAANIKDSGHGSLTLTSNQQRVVTAARQDLQLGRSVCLHGPKGCGKSAVLDALAAPNR